MPIVRWKYGDHPPMDGTAAYGGYHVPSSSESPSESPSASPSNSPSNSPSVSPSLSASPSLSPSSSASQSLSPSSSISASRSPSSSSSSSHSASPSQELPSIWPWIYRNIRLNVDMANPIPLVRTFTGDTAPVLRFTIVRKGGVIIDLTDCGVDFRIKKVVSSEVTNPTNSDCLITEPTSGICTYTMNPTDFPEAGCYMANVKITYPDGKIERAEVEVEAIESI